MLVASGGVRPHVHVVLLRSIAGEMLSNSDTRISNPYLDEQRNDVRVLVHQIHAVIDGDLPAVVGLHEPAQRGRLRGRPVGATVGSVPISRAEGSQLEVLRANGTDIVEAQRVRVQAAHLCECGCVAGCQGNAKIAHVGCIGLTWSVFRTRRMSLRHCSMSASIAVSLTWRAA